MILIVITNVKINYQPEVKLNDGRIVNSDLIKEMRGLKDALNANEDLKMQELYPEGYVFLNVIYSLAWYNLLEKDRSGAFAGEGVAEIEKAWQKIINSQRAYSAIWIVLQGLEYLCLREKVKPGEVDSR
jgi:hypothetical protein